jgi:hypothetical protein
MSETLFGGDVLQLALNDMKSLRHLVIKDTLYFGGRVPMNEEDLFDYDPEYAIALDLDLPNLETLHIDAAHRLVRLRIVAPRLRELKLNRLPALRSLEIASDAVERLTVGEFVTPQEDRGAVMALILRQQGLQHLDVCLDNFTNYDCFQFVSGDPNSSDFKECKSQAVLRLPTLTSLRFCNSGSNIHEKIMIEGHPPEHQPGSVNISLSLLRSIEMYTFPDHEDGTFVPTDFFKMIRIQECPLLGTCTSAYPNILVVEDCPSLILQDSLHADDAKRRRSGDSLRIRNVASVQESIVKAYSDVDLRSVSVLDVSSPDFKLTTRLVARDVFFENPSLVFIGSRIESFHLSYDSSYVPPPIHKKHPGYHIFFSGCIALHTIHISLPNPFIAQQLFLAQLASLRILSVQEIASLELINVVGCPVLITVHLPSYVDEDAMMRKIRKGRPFSASHEH